MKSEERHKLQQNELADWLAKTITTIKPYQNAIISAVIVLILAVIFLTWWMSESTVQASKTWTSYIEALSAADTASLEKIAEDNPKSSAAPAANLAAADIKLAQGCNMLFVSKATANQELNKAAELYENVIKQTSNPILSVQATFGLAKTRESQGKLDDAIALYAKVAKDLPETVFTNIAADRLNILKQKSTKEMYDRFAQFDPKPAFSQPSGEKTGIDKIPDEPPPSISESLSDLGASEKKTDETEAKTEAQGDESKPADTTPNQ